MGLLVVTGVCRNPKAFYCADETYDRQFTYQPNPTFPLGALSGNLAVCDGRWNEPAYAVGL